MTGGATAFGVGWPGFPATAGAFAGCGALIGVVGAARTRQFNARRRWRRHNGGLDGCAWR